METIVLTLAGKGARGVRKCLETLEEITQGGLHLRREQVAVLAQQFAVAVIKAGKTQAFAQAACLRSRCPFRRIDLTCHNARIAAISNEIVPSGQSDGAVA